MPKTIQELQADVQRFKAQKQGLPDPTLAPATTSTTTPSSRPTTSSTGRDFAAIDAKLAARKPGDTGVSPEQAAADAEPGIGEKIVQGLFSAPATIVARPFQAAAALAGASNDQIDEATNKIPFLGGLIQDAPDNFGDVKKDVGRAAQTVALGTGAPIAGGALFGAGASLEAGNDLLSVQTLVDTALGGAGGKVLDWVGKPIFNAAGKVVGTITPQIIKDAAMGGAKGIARFAEEHQLLGGIAAKPSAAIAKGFQAVDDTIMNTVKTGGAGLKKVAAEQFPGMDPVAHYTRATERDLVKPTTLNESKYSKATAIYNDAKSRGIDLEKHATQNRIFHDDLIGDGKFNTVEAEQALRDAVYKDGNEIIRPALKDIEPGVRLVPIKEVRDAMLKRVDGIPDAKLSVESKAQMKKTIERTYGDKSAEAAAHPNGYSLTNLHDARIERGANGKYVAGISTEPSIMKAKLARQQAKVFEDLFDQTIPASAGLADIRREFQKSFMLADYLKALNGRKVPEGAAKKAVRLFGRAAAATVGGKIGGFPGAILGSQYGDMLFASFEALPNPLKKIVLSKLAAEKSPAFDVLRKYLGDVKAEKILQKALPPAGGSTFKEKGSTLFTTPGGVSTTDKGEAFDISAVEKGAARTPKDGRTAAQKRKLIEYIQENGEGPYVPASSLPSIKTGRKPKLPRLDSDIAY